MRPLPTLLLALLLAGPALASPQGTGAGFMIGEPLGGTVKTWVDQDEAWVVGLGVSFLRDASIQVQGDYLLHFFKLSPDLTLPDTPFYLGLGLRLNGPEDGRAELGIRLPFGALYLLDQDKTEFFVELVPVLDVTPRLSGDINFGAGLRFYGW